tara:strand:- start:5422 stop:6921 length:1500 start_codon:yes stop_codon:yes gene_type:complete
MNYAIGVSKPMIRQTIHTVRSRFQRARLRTQLIITINIFVAVLLAGYLYTDYNESVRSRLADKAVSLSDEARTIQAAVQELRVFGDEVIQRHIDTVCATMNSGDSPGHIIEVTVDDVRIFSDATEHSHDHSSPWSELVIGSFSIGDVAVRVGERRKPLVAKVRGESLEGLGVLVSVSALGALILNLLLVRLVTRPLEYAVAAVRDVGRGKLGTTVVVNANFELSQLANEVSQMSLELARRDGDRNAQLDRARRLQTHLVPNILSKAGIAIAIEFHPAEEIAGDYIDVIECPNGDILFCVADVVGHGIHAAMGSSVLKALLLAVDIVDLSPSAMLAWINQRFCSASLPEDFATMMLLRLSADRKRLVYASAGHELGYLRHADGKIQELNSTGMVLGISNDAEFDDIEYQLYLDDFVVLLSDGVSETFDSSRTILGRDKVVSVIRDPAHSEANGMASEIISVASKHRGESPALDDMTVLILNITHQAEVSVQPVQRSSILA